ncbi:MAG: hypothetical protein EOP83_10015 [Verrucomicrobiaceae bacterium]|nr:MAG: hypothetical protein EOP83_10015 [Verrucomicrobiaceae bacterium]
MIDSKPPRSQQEAEDYPLRAISVHTTWCACYCIHVVKLRVGWSAESYLHREYLTSQGCTGFYVYWHDIGRRASPEVYEMRFSNPLTALAFKLRFG